LTFHSEALQATRSFCIVLPAGYTKDKTDYPVLVLLHGRGRSRHSLIDNPATMDALARAPFITLLPPGDDGWYIDSPLIKKDKYEQPLSETIQVAEEKYRLSKDRSRRGIIGWSMNNCRSSAFRRSGGSNDAA
jgi:enterochelin esterase-like enzyme